MGVAVPVIDSDAVVEHLRFLLPHGLGWFGCDELRQDFDMNPSARLGRGTDEDHIPSTRLAEQAGFKNHLAFWIADQEGNESAIFRHVGFDETHLARCQSGGLPGKLDL